MAKRRFRSTPDKAPEELTPEERRAQRKRDRLKSAGGKRTGGKGLAPPVRRVVILGVPAAVVVAVIAILLLNPFHAQVPCLSFSPSPSGVPAFPPKGTTDFSGTWCPPSAPLVVQEYPMIRITVNGANVALPDSIGRNSNFTSHYQCDLPLHTSLAGSGLPAGAFTLGSPWAYSYSLSDFFQIWSQSYAYASVNGSNQPIVYSANDLLGYSSDATHKVSLYVDSQPNSAGPNLTLNTLPNLANPYPSCLGEVYGTGHVILLTYGLRSAAAVSSHLDARVGVSPTTQSAADPARSAIALGGDLAGAAAPSHPQEYELAGLGWLSVRVF